MDTEWNIEDIGDAVLKYYLLSLLMHIQHIVPALASAQESPGQQIVFALS